MFGGGGGDGSLGVYGSLRRKDTEAILASMHLESNSNLLDVGSGLGIPLMLALLIHGVARAKGVEINRCTWLKSKPLCQAVAHRFRLPMPRLVHGDAARMRTLGRATHVLAVWEGWARADQEAVAALFNASRTACCITVVHSRRHHQRGDVGAYIASLGFVGLQPAPTFERSVKCGRTTLAAFTFVKASSDVSAGRAQARSGRPRPRATTAPEMWR